jgi:hypothetical protein
MNSSPAAEFDRRAAPRALNSAVVELGGLRVGTQDRGAVEGLFRGGGWCVVERRNVVVGQRFET